MPRIKICGITMDLPYAPYPAQIVTISKLIGAFQTNGCALIESPTGTGKSLSIICAALGFLESSKRNISVCDTQMIRPMLGNGVDKSNVYKNNVDLNIFDKNIIDLNIIDKNNVNNGSTQQLKIYICSRTHKQLDQLVDQLRQTKYKPNITVLGSKNHYCINPRLKDVSDKNTACLDLVKTNSCVYYNGFQRLKKKVSGKLFDIEELRTEGKKCVGCPYFASRELCEDAEIIFAPYNYLIDPKIRMAMNLDLSNAMIIIDEAHNIEDACRSAGSLEITSKLIDIISNEVIGAMKKSVTISSDDNLSIKDQFISVLEFIRKFRDYAEKVEFDTKNFECQQVIRKGPEIIKELNFMEISKESFLQFRNSYDKIAGHEDAKTLLPLTTSQILEEIILILNMILFGATDSYGYCFKKFNTEYVSYSLNFWLLDPAIIFNQLAKSVRSICLLSGTMTPFSSFSGELGHSFDHKIIAPHILTKDQVFIANVSFGHLRKELLGTYSIAETFDYLDQISKIILDVSESVGTAGGVLVFVPSYSFQKRLSKNLKSDVLIEPQSGGMDEFEKVLNKYKNRIGKRSAIMLCVYRGKASEGIDFKDEFARAVIAVGIPYPSIKDPQIALKKEFNNLNGRLSGHAWYQAQTFRAVNQALGRVVRHKKDWGAVFLLDSRYHQQSIMNSLPAWVSSNRVDYDCYSDCVKSLREFINEKKNKSIF